MRTHIDNGWVVAFDGRSHQVYERGSVVFEDDRIVHAGSRYTGSADTRIDAAGRLVSPGFINTHVHTTGNGGDYLLGDMAKNDYRTSNYMAFAAPLKGKMAPPPPPAVAALRTFVFLHALKNGTTTIIDVGGVRGDWDGYARLVDELGVRVYGSPPFRDRDTFMDAQGRLTYEEDVAVGRERLKEAVGFVKSFDKTAQGRLRGMLNAAQVETCTERLLREGRDAARELDVPIHTHAGGNLIEFQQIMGENRRTPIQFLADIGFLDDRSLIGHAVITGGHPWTGHPFGDDIRVLAERGATVGHCPYKYAKMAMTLRSFQRYLQGCRRGGALGTETLRDRAQAAPADLAKTYTDGRTRPPASRRRNAATPGGRFLRRDELGRLAPAPRPRSSDHADHLARGCTWIRSRRWWTRERRATCTRSSWTEVPVEDG